MRIQDEGYDGEFNYEGRIISYKILDDDHFQPKMKNGEEMLSRRFNFYCNGKSLDIITFRDSTDIVFNITPSYALEKFVELKVYEKLKFI